MLLISLHLRNRCSWVPMDMHSFAHTCEHPRATGATRQWAWAPWAWWIYDQFLLSGPEHLRETRFSPENNKEKWKVRSIWERFTGRQGYRSPHDEKMKKDGAPYMILIWPISNGGRSLHPPQILSEFRGEQSACVRACVCVCNGESKRKEENRRKWTLNKCI